MEVVGRYLPRAEFDHLLQLLKQQGYRTFAPQVKDGAILYQPIDHSSQLPCGVRDEQQPGQYRLRHTDDPHWFAWANGPQCLKPLSFAPEEILWRATRDSERRLSFQTVEPEVSPVAVIGVRACDLAALRLQEAHFLQAEYPDPYFQARRRALLLIAVDCAFPAETCFCTSTGDGPAVTDGYDIRMAELDEGLVVWVGSKVGAKLVDALGLLPASQRQIDRVEAQTAEAKRRQTRRLPPGDLNSLLFSRLNHPRWDEVGDRCLACGNCTSVCPTCFCHSEQETPALDGDTSEHRRRWDSCFSHDHSYIHGLLVRPDSRSRYRQWLTHKLGGWIEQYGRSGCVGCGRCISWCPVGIDLTEEAAAICAGDRHD